MIGDQSSTSSDRERAGALISFAADSPARLSCCVLSARMRPPPSIHTPAPPPTRAGEQASSRSQQPSCGAARLRPMTEGAVGLGDARVAAQLAQVRERCNQRSTNTGFDDARRAAGPYRIPRRPLQAQSPSVARPAAVAPAETPAPPPPISSTAIVACLPSSTRSRKQRRKERCIQVNSEREEAAHELRELISRKKAELEKLEELVKYAAAAPVEMRRHQQMAHEVGRHGERLVCLSAKLSVPTLLRHLEKAHDRHGFAEHVLNDPCVWQDECGRQAVQRAVRAGWDSVADALLHVRVHECVLGRVLGELRGELTALRASSEALAQSQNVNAAEEFAARVRRAHGLLAYGEWGASSMDQL